VELPAGKSAMWEHLRHTTSPVSSSPLLCVGWAYSEAAGRSVYLRPEGAACAFDEKITFALHSGSWLWT
jgi:hypothetical protein